ncbi:carboxypeptidase-like regulatory domain-containing protein [Zunongwangia sp. F363]|uniref:Carboxypeptidase-like regulatory domain-containing protein n=1 Tax=Autumnicola tepida TaxID=3075595 RepID=A0ABU3CBC7_9FLAO|nr:carboxypeptidase-like regulatory domain-containing protein [Zunongwangia sp. F363]MDT0643512.1 carboxypeptidase-like regulatory domain-containing protein [Zunongwangia sp. F363]
MKQLFSALFLLCFYLTTAQEKHVVGQVVNAETLEPLPYVNIVLEEKHRGTSTDGQGRFSFLLKNAAASTVLKFSYVGFKTKRINLAALEGKVVRMQPEVSNLSEVRLYNITREHSEKINDFRGKDPIGLGNFSGGQFPSIVARYYERPENFEGGCFLEQVEVRFFSTGLNSGRRSKFRLRIMAVGEDGLPGEDLLRSDLIVERDPNRFKVKMPLLKYRIFIPEEGFFVAVEHLFIEENKYVEEKDYRVYRSKDTLLYKDVKIVKYLPVFKGTLEKGSGNFKSYFKDTNGWKKMNILDNSNPALKGEVPAPAFKITLTD